MKNTILLLDIWLEVIKKYDGHECLILFLRAVLRHKVKYLGNKGNIVVKDLFTYLSYQLQNERMTIVIYPNLKIYHVFHTNLRSGKKQKWFIDAYGYVNSPECSWGEREGWNRPKPKDRYFLDDFYDMHQFLFTESMVSLPDYFKMIIAEPEIPWYEEYIELCTSSSLIRWRKGSAYLEIQNKKEYCNLWLSSNSGASKDIKIVF